LLLKQPRSRAGGRQHYSLSTRGEGRGEDFVLLSPLLHLPKPPTPSAGLFSAMFFVGERKEEKAKPELSLFAPTVEQKAKVLGRFGGKKFRVFLS
jgi:hypothetical protein